MDYVFVECSLTLRVPANNKLKLSSGTIPANSNLLSGTSQPIAIYCPEPFRPIAIYCQEPFRPNGRKDSKDLFAWTDYKAALNY